jgi:hypothetical protein
MRDTAMDKTIRRVTDFKEQQAETYRYWQSRPVAERMEAVSEIIRDVYWMKGIDIDALPMDKTIVRVKRSPVAPAEKA